MLDAYLAGDVPHGVFADWCEEHGIVFPRAVVVAIHRSRWTRRSESRSSAPYIGILEYSLSSENVGSRTGEREIWRSISGSRTERSSNGSLSNNRRSSFSGARLGPR